jgi:hypothetical protein
MEAVGQKLLDFSQPFDVAALDQVVQCMNDPKSPHQRVANQIMVALQEHQDSWTRASDILEQSNSVQTKFFGLQVRTTQRNRSTQETDAGFVACRRSWKMPSVTAGRSCPRTSAKALRATSWASSCRCVDRAELEKRLSWDADGVLGAIFGCRCRRTSRRCTASACS